jgi:magnesium-transporting ATPase (P-type)
MYAASWLTYTYITSDIEKDLIFTGCINYQNPMKQEALQVVAELKEGNVDVAVVTGDNVLTGKSFCLIKSSCSQASSHNI